MKACTAQQMRTIDQRAAAEYGMPTLLLMENAGRAVAECALKLLQELPAPVAGERTVRIFCGKGNNGGDGLVAARHLFNTARCSGLNVVCHLTADPSEVKGDARTNLELVEKLGIPLVQFLEGPDAELEADLLIDALLGTGFQGEPRGALAAAIAAINGSGIPVLAVDVPSGLNADTGQPANPCVRAVETVTFGLPKQGLIVEPGRTLAGRVAVAEISLPRPLLEEPSIQAEWISAERVRPLWPARASGAHKGDSGKLFVLAGSPGLTGAAAMCCQAALRAGTGLVTLGIPRSLHPIAAGKLTEAMTLPLPETETGGHGPESLPELQRRLAATGALAAGPGFGRDPASGRLLRDLLADLPVPVVLDADGLNLLAPANEQTFPARCVITPHPGEMARLLGTELGEIQSNRLDVSRAAAARFGCVVVLKGPDTVVAAPDGRLAVNSSGGPALATGGTGDVLTGIVGACLARGLEPFEAAVASVFLHGLAGEVAGERYGAPGTIAGDVVAAIPEALRRLQVGNIPGPCRII